MKKSIILAALLAASVGASAQLKVYSTGKANVNCNTQFSKNKLTVGEKSSPSSFTGYNNGLFSQNLLSSGCHNIAVYGESSYNSIIGSGRSVGVLGVAGYASNGYNYGVMGRLKDNQNGAGIYGSIVNDMGTYVNGKYAGYFYGPVYVEGTVTITNAATPPDIRLKENILALSDADRGRTLDKVLGMNVITYNYKQREVPEAEADTTGTRQTDSRMTAERHFGLSAQELQAIYPDLVRKGQDGYLTVNYLELVPVLIQSIQELKAELDEVRGGSARSTSTTALTKITATGNVLYQNTPNPFREQTTIRFQLADDAHDAAICIFDMTGKMLKKLPISSGETSVSIGGWELGEGMFLYTLIINGREIDTKRMVITK